MALLHMPLAQVDEVQLRRLVHAKMPEARDIEYKRQTYGPGDVDHAEWLADVSSFANTAGGDLIIGIKASAGIPTSIEPLTIDLDQEILRLEQISRSNLQPRITNLSFKRVQIATGGEVLIVRIPRSYNPPHRIVRTGKGQNRFWARSSAGKYEPNVEELRLLFTLAPQLTERIRDFRIDRLAKIAAHSAPVTLIGQTCLVMHVVPFSSFDPGAYLSVAAVNQDPHPFAPMGYSGAPHWRVNFDGVLISTEPSHATYRAYTQVFRSGRLEAVRSMVSASDRPKGSPGRLTSIQIEGFVLTTLVRSLKGLLALGVEPPFAVMISLLGVKGVHMNVGVKANWFIDDDISVLNEDQFHFAEVILDSTPSSIQECGMKLMPFIDQLANTAGRAVSSSFGPSGEYLHLFN